ncbi:hypothetical protein [Corynebacterium endometrii]|uniref:Uncharacterized protein n=1 Tax=Corynebacterium endometrii TaxID=2488819 RepID=A0A4P7QDN1_9CORY|nr:hypothetical protein [Corynebacterium endometrii]QCB27509.1 hypothetical protein CENDO_01025 [Corynebacterium endometrii]
MVPITGIEDVAPQTVTEGKEIELIEVNPVNPESTVVVTVPEGLVYDPEAREVTGVPVVEEWDADEESRAVTVEVVVTNPGGGSMTEEIVVTVERDTDGDGEPDLRDSDDDNDGVSDIEEIEKGSDPKDDGSFPATPMVPITGIEDVAPQTVTEGKEIELIEVNPVNPESTVVVTVPEGLVYDPEAREVTGVPVVEEWDADEESRAVTVEVVVTNPGGGSMTEEIVVTVERDTDGDGEPDLRDSDDDNDGVSDEVEIEKGSDPKDDGSFPATPMVPITGIEDVAPQTVTEGKEIELIEVNPVNPESTVVVTVPEGLVYDPEAREVTGVPVVEEWDADEESRAVTVEVVVTNPGGGSMTEEIVVTVERDTDGDGEPDLRDSDDDNDGVSDIEEIEKGSDPKDDGSFPATPMVPITGIEDVAPQTVTEGKEIELIEVNPVNPESTVVVTVPEGLVYDPEAREVTGVPVVEEWDADEESRAVTVEVVVTNPGGGSMTEEIVVTVERDTDGDGEPDLRDSDDDNDGVSDIEEIEKGSDPKDDGSFPATPMVPITGIEDVAPQTVTEGKEIELIEVNPVNPESTVVVTVPEGLVYDPEAREVTGVPVVEEWDADEESRAVTVEVVVTNPGGGSMTEEIVVTVERDTDGDGEPDLRDSDDDNDGVSDEVEIEKGSDPKDDGSFPATPMVPITGIEDVAPQTVTEGKEIELIEVNPVNPESTVVVTVPEGLVYDPEAREVTGVPVVEEWDADEESRAVTVEVVVTNPGGGSMTEEIVVTVERDTDGDGEPDLRDSDDDNDGVSDEVEIDKGSDPKDKGSIPVDPESDVHEPSYDSTAVTPDGTATTNDPFEGEPELNEVTTSEVDGWTFTTDPVTGQITAVAPSLEQLADAWDDAVAKLGDAPIFDQLVAELGDLLNPTIQVDVTYGDGTQDLGKEASFILTDADGTPGLDPSGDFDADGVMNADELENGTNPFEPDSDDTIVVPPVGGSSLNEKCIPTGLAVGLPLLLLIPLGLANQMNIPGLEQLQAQVGREINKVNNQLRDLNTQAQKRLGIWQENNQVINEINRLLNSDFARTTAAVVAGAIILGLLINNCASGGSSSGSSDTDAGAPNEG